MEYLKELISAYYGANKINEQEASKEDAIAAYEDAVKSNAGLSKEPVKAPGSNQATLPFVTVNNVKIMNGEKGISFGHIEKNQKIPGISAPRIAVGTIDALPPEKQEKVKSLIGYALLGVSAPEEDEGPVQQGKTGAEKAASRAEVINQEYLIRRQQEIEALASEKFKSEHDLEVFKTVDAATTDAMSIFASSKFKDLWESVIVEKQALAQGTDNEDLKQELELEIQQLTQLKDSFHNLSDRSILDLMTGLDAGGGRPHSLLTKLGHPAYFIKIDNTSTAFSVTSSEKNPETVDLFLRQQAAKSIKALTGAIKNLSDGKPIDYSDRIYLNHFQFDDSGKNVRIIPTQSSDRGLILGGLQDNHPLTVLAKTYLQLIEKESNPELKEEYAKHKPTFKGSLSKLLAGEGKVDSQLNNKIGTFAEKVVEITIPIFAQLRATTSAEDRKKLYDKLFIKVRDIKNQFSSDTLSDVTKSLLRDGVGNVAISDEAYMYLEELKKHAVTNSGGWSEADIENMLNNIVITGLKLTAQTYAERRQPIDAFTVGEKGNVNAKKPDIIELYKDENSLRESLLRDGIPQKQIDSLLLQSQTIEKSYLGGKKLRNQDAKIAVAVGLKTYMTLKDGVKFGTTMITSYLEKTQRSSQLIKSLNKSFDSIDKLLDTISPPKGAGVEYKIKPKDLEKVKSKLVDQVNSIDLTSIFGENPSEEVSKKYQAIKTAIDGASDIESIKLVMGDIRHQLVIDNLKAKYSKGPKNKAEATQELVEMFRSSTIAPEFDMISQIQVFGEKKPKTISVGHNQMVNYFMDQVTTNPNEFEFIPGTAGGFTMFKYVLDSKGKRVKNKSGKYQMVKMGKLYIKRQGPSSQIQSYFSEEGLQHFTTESPDYKQVNDSSEILIKFLHGQRKLIEDIIYRFQK